MVAIKYDGGLSNNSSVGITRANCIWTLFDSTIILLTFQNNLKVVLYAILLKALDDGPWT